jgi:hypothetical protein
MNYYREDSLAPDPEQSNIDADIPADLDFSSADIPLAKKPEPESQSAQIVQFPDTDSAQQRLKNLYNLVGNCVVVPIPCGEKGPRTGGWQNVTFEQSLQTGYQQKLCECFRRGGNLGILLGPASDDLVDIDIDIDQHAEPFLEANPRLRETLRRRGKRGCGLMVRIEGEYPIGKWDLKLADGTKFGEWRAGGGHQSVIFGRHPETNGEGKPIDYQIVVVKPPVQIRFEEIVWPDWIKRPLPWIEALSPQPHSKANPHAQREAIDLDKRIRAYLATIPEAVSGQHGHDATFKVACILIQGWDLSVDEARPHLQAYNALCKPPWSERELEHKLAEAIKAPCSRPYGYLRDAPAQQQSKSRPRDIGDDWQEPQAEMPTYEEVDPDTIVDEDEEPVPIFPLDTLPERFRKPVEEVMRHYRVPALLPATCALVINSVALGRGVVARSNIRRTYANLYAIIGAQSGSGKTPAFDEFMTPLLQMQKASFEQFNTAQKPQAEAELKLLGNEIQQLTKSGKKPSKFNIAEDCRHEKLAELLQKKADGR